MDLQTAQESIDNILSSRRSVQGRFQSLYLAFFLLIFRVQSIISCIVGPLSWLCLESLVHHFLIGLDLIISHRIVVLSLFIHNEVLCALQYNSHDSELN